MATEKHTDKGRQADREKSSRELERELDATRENIDHTLDELEARLSPGQLVDQAVSYLRRSGPPDFARNLGRTVNENPLPVVVTGAGLVWLMVASSRPSYREAGSASDALGSAAERAGGVAEGAREKAHRVRSAGASAASSARALGESASDAAHRMQGEAAHRAGQIRRGFERTLDEEPLLAGVASFALGALLGAVLPPTRAEDEAVGPMRDRVLAQAAEAGAEKAQDVAQETRSRARKVGRRERGEDDATRRRSAAGPPQAPGA